MTIEEARNEAVALLAWIHEGMADATENEVEEAIAQAELEDRWEQKTRQSAQRSSLTRTG